MFCTLGQGFAMVKRFWVGLVLLAFIGASFTAATISVSPASAAACFISFANKTTADGLGNNAVNGVYVDGSNVYAATIVGLSISSDCVSSSSSSASSASPGIPGISLVVNPVLVGKPVEGAPIYCGADSIQPNSNYTLSVQSVTNSALTRTVLDSGTVNTQGHLNERVSLGALNPGSYKIVMTGIHASGHQLVLTNYITVGANGVIVSVSAENLQPFLN